MYEALGRAVAGRPCMCHVQGPSGSGKSALVERFLSILAAGGNMLVLTGRCYEQESVPFKAVDGLIDALSVHLLQKSSAQAAPADLRALTRVFTVLRSAFAGEQSWPASIGLRNLHTRAMAALGELLSELCRSLHAGSIYRRSAVGRSR
jgi:eukaryotic-like serine/threonine-protein kinase